MTQPCLVFHRWSRSQQTQCSHKLFPLACQESLRWPQPVISALTLRLHTHHIDMTLRLHTHHTDTTLRFACLQPTTTVMLVTSQFQLECISVRRKSGTKLTRGYAYWVNPTLPKLVRLPSSTCCLIYVLLFYVLLLLRVVALRVVSSTCCFHYVLFSTTHSPRSF